MFGEFEIILIVFLGAVFGSFITAASWRLPREQNLVSESSKCTKCSHKLEIRDLVPIFSWLVNKGRCRYCKAKVGFRYILTELITVAVFVLHYELFGFGAEFAIYTTMAVALLILIISDFETYIIPDTTIVLLIISAVAAAIYQEKDYQDLIFAAALGLFVSLVLRKVFIWLLKKDPLGFGDIKLFGVVGLWIGSWMLPFYCAMCGLIGIITGIFWQKIFKKEVFPFGPAMAISLYIMVIFGDVIGDIMLPK